MRNNYRYVRFNTETGKAYALFLVSWDESNKDKCKVSAAFCNPNDSFVKARARKMVDVRMNENRFGRVIQVKRSISDSKIISNDEFKEILKEVMTTNVLANDSDLLCGDLEEKPFAPNWARRAFKTNNFKFGTGATPQEIEEMKAKAILNAERRARLNQNNEKA